MLKKCLVLVLAAFFLATSVYVAASLAGHGGKDGKGKKDLEKKVLCKAHFMLMNKEEIGLSDEQVNTIKKLKSETKKETIRDQAEVDVLVVDIKMKLWNDPINTDEIDALIDKKYDIKKKKAKALVAAYAGLKKVLTEDQKEKAKELWKACKYGKKGSKK
ncbi:MAG: hypothetical protein HQ594_04740 [Candidatus Omnitrophica bacterium]|nr:hypothetical protein [Candidatus Omnitrophota bacterium]